MEALLLIASLMLNKSNQVEFNSLLTEFNESQNIKSFYHSANVKKYTQHLDLDFWGDEDELTNAQLLYAFSVEKKAAQFIDWKGEHEENQLKSLITNQLKEKNIHDFDWKFLKEFDKRVDLGELEQGDYIIKKLIIVDKHLQKRGFRLAFFNPGEIWDGYIPFIVSEKQYDVVKTIRCDEHGNECTSLSNIDDDF
ncbi:hypothetical protein LRP50_12455 [Enterovibrio sp. ZSDZ42]|uniref:DUF6630 domain-containing protein n=1 Tax=Enterovibrio gelatinilyticus TaxID=2899819 RepID=A0ABT5R254_9GAMM|nr:hypothetical protein [Enterovibrio sp. ZSDZ42]MDD1793945.1 hypothetical protein [Enterovibrio sp. ZSDZ42]